MTHTFKTGVSPAFAFPTEKVIHEARFFDHTGDCKMAHTFKTGDTGLTRNKSRSFVILADDLKSERPLAVRFTEISNGYEFVSSRFPDGRCGDSASDYSDLDLMPPEPKVIGSVWGVIFYDSLHSISFPEMFFNNRETAVERAMQLKSHWIARFDTYDDPEHTVDVKVEKVK